MTTSVVMGTENIRTVDFGASKPRRRTVYAISFDLNQEQLAQHYRNSSTANAYGEIRKFLEARDFEWKQGSLYFGDPDKVDNISTIVAIIDLTRAFSWFQPSLRDIRMLRIEDNNDLNPIVERAAGIGDQQRFAVGD